MADGSLRITFEFEPRDAAKAFELFGARGRNVAVAALVDGRGAVKEPASVVLMGGPLSKSAAMLDKNPEFIDFIYGGDPRDYILEVCAVSSRKELDHDPVAGQKFHDVMAQFNRWRQDSNQVQDSHYGNPINRL